MFKSLIKKFQCQYNVGRALPKKTLPTKDVDISKALDYLNSIQSKTITRNQIKIALQQIN
jgi:hypothetical protein